LSLVSRKDRRRAFGNHDTDTRTEEKVAVLDGKHNINRTKYKIYTVDWAL